MNQPLMFILDKRLGQGDHDVNPAWILWARAHLQKLATDLNAVLTDNQMALERIKKHEEKIKVLEGRLKEALLCEECKTDAPHCDKKYCLFPDLRGEDPAPVDVAAIKEIEEKPKEGKKDERP